MKRSVWDFTIFSVFLMCVVKKNHFNFIRKEDVFNVVPNMKCSEMMLHLVKLPVRKIVSLIQDQSQELE